MTENPYQSPEAKSEPQQKRVNQRLTYGLSALAIILTAVIGLFLLDMNRARQDAEQRTIQDEQRAIQDEQRAKVLKDAAP